MSGVMGTDILSVLPPDVIESLAEQMPLGHLGRLEGIAEAVAFFASEEASFATG